MKSYVHQEPTLSFKASGGSYVLPLTNLANNGVAWSARAPLTGNMAPTATRPAMYRWRAAMTISGGVADQTVDIYAATSDGTVIDGNIAATSGTGTDQSIAKNMTKLGSVTVQSAGTTFVASGDVVLTDPNVSIVVVNTSGGTISVASYVTLTPYTEVE